MNPVLYLIMRNDIPSMNPGKLAAQAAHVANAFEYEFNKSGQAKKHLGKLYKEWKNQTKQGFGTTIVLGADHLLIYPGYYDGCFSGRVYDPTYPCPIPVEIADAIQDKYPDNITRKNIFTPEESATFLRNQEVGGYVFGDKDNWKVQDHVRGVELYP